jgi:hypothetical protein
MGLPRELEEMLEKMEARYMRNKLHGDVLQLEGRDFSLLEKGLSRAQALNELEKGSGQVLVDDSSGYDPDVCPY